MIYQGDAYNILKSLRSLDANLAMHNLNIIRDALGDTEYQERLEEIEKTSPKL